MTRDNDLARQLEEAGDRFRKEVDRIGADGLDHPTPAGWTAKEMLGHMGFWMEASEAVVEAMFRGRELPVGWAFGSGYMHGENDGPWPRADVHNAREAEWTHGRTSAEVIDRLDQAHARALELARSLTEEELADKRFRDHFQEKTVHYDEHRAELEAL